jgi:hypothetical protein
MRPDELHEESDLLTANLLPAVAPRFSHNRSMPEKKAERKGLVPALSANFAPHGRSRRFRIPRRQQELRLMHLEPSHNFLSVPPPNEPPLRQPFLA